MNSLITNFNSWGERFLNFAGPMLWQSSLLIVVLFVLDLALRRKVRPAVRYALWLVLLVKLILPPTLAAPTSIAWWIRPSPNPQPPAREFVVSFPNGEQPPPSSNLYEAFTGGALQSPGPSLSSQGWLLVGLGLVNLGLLMWMLLRWWQVARMVRRASPATDALADLVNDTRQTLGLRRAVSLRFTDRPMSPAVCGLFWPAIILPQSLAEHLPPNQLRAVLLHELVHLKRGDVWVNCAQALLQIVYWWHPLLWLANARIRRLREEAVDDAVMLALRDDAPTYAPTLLEVAKLAFPRPTTALGLVGIMESRSALRQRIERLVNSDTPRKSGLTIFSAVGVLAFSAVAVPMEQAPVTTTADNSAHANSGSQDSLLASVVSASPVASKTNGAALVQSGRLLLEVGKLDEAEAELKKASALDPENQAASYYLGLVGQARHLKTEGEVLPPATADARTNIIYPSKARLEILNKLGRIRLAHVFYDNVRLEDVIRSLTEEVKQRDPDGRGVLLVLNAGSDQPRATVIDPSIGLPPAKNYASAPDLNWPLIKVNPALNNLTLGDVLDVIVKVADRPIRYSIEDFGVVFSARWPTEELFMREFKLDRQSFCKWARYAAGIPPSKVEDTGYLEGEEAQAMHGSVRRLFLVNGVDLNQPKSVYYSDGKGLLLVKASRSDLDTIQRLVEEWNTTSPPAVIQADKVPVLGDLPGLGKLFRSESNANRKASGGVSRPDELTNAVSNGTGASANDKASSPDSTIRPSPLPNAEPLHMREFKVDSQAFNKWLQYAATVVPTEETGRSPANDGRILLPRVSPREMESPALSPSVHSDLPQSPERGGVVSLTRTNNMKQMHQALRGLFSASGVDLSPPKSVFYNDRVGILLVNAAESDLDAIQRLVEEWNTTSPPTSPSSGVFLDPWGKPYYLGKLTVPPPSSGNLSDSWRDPSLTNTPRRQSGFKEAVENDVSSFIIRRFKVEPKRFFQSLEAATGIALGRTETNHHGAGEVRSYVRTSTSAEVTRAVEVFLKKLGVNMGLPGRSAFFQERTSELLVSATQTELASVTQAVEVLNAMEKQINIKAMMVELSPREARALQAEFWPDSGTNQLGILTEAKFRAVREALRKRADADVVSMPEVTTVSGRQAQVQSVELRTVVSGLSNSVTNGATNSAFQTTTIPFGPVLDVVPHVAADGISIQMTVIPTVTEFLGYDDPKDFTSKLPPGERPKSKLPLPRMRVRQITTSAVVFDGQTIVLANFPDVIATRHPDGRETKKPNPSKNAKQLIVFITPTIVDQAGNRTHTAR